MNKTINTITTGIIFLLVVTSCEFNSEEELYGDELVIVTPVSFSSDIFPIIQMSCATTACHTQGGFGNGYFEDYDDVLAKVNNGSLRQRVLVDMDMPPTGLTDNERALIESWIDDGAPNN